MKPKKRTLLTVQQPHLLCKERGQVDIFESFGFGFVEFCLRKKESRFLLRKIWSRKESLGFEKFGLRKKSQFWRIWSQKKSRFRFQSKFWSYHSAAITFITIACAK